MRTVYAVLSVLLISACANPYARFYRGVEDARTRPDYIPATEPLRVYSTEDFDRDVKALMQRGYVPIGQSVFNAAANSVSEAQVREHAAKVGAHVVLVSSKYSHTVSGAMPLTLPTTTTSYSTGSATAYGPGGPVTAFGQGTTTTYGTQTTYIPYSINRADFGAVFLIRAKSRIGIYTRPLNDEMKRRIERNAGALVSVVVEGSPAFEADILPGDVLISFGGQTVRSSEHYHQELVPSFRGDSAELVLLRDGRTLEKTLRVRSY